MVSVAIFLDPRIMTLDRVSWEIRGECHDHETVGLLFIKPFLGHLFLSLSHKHALRLQE